MRLSLHAQAGKQRLHIDPETPEDDCRVEDVRASL
jgi:hypothetical protein